MNAYGGLLPTGATLSSFDLFVELESNYLFNVMVLFFTAFLEEMGTIGKLEG